MNAHRRIEICGGIASGKTTLCKGLQRYTDEAEFEDFTKNPFWLLFYQAPNLHAFETEVTFLLQHYSKIKTSNPVLSLVAFDYSLLQDQAYARVNLDGRRLEAFESIYRFVTEELPPPALIVHLRCSPGEELRRIKIRAREEEKTIQLSYVHALNRAIACAVDEVRAGVRVLEIDSAALDFAHDSETRKKVVSDILAAVREG
jgi:deoxyadenosine/deoxycytidine kinase